MSKPIPASLRFLGSSDSQGVPRWWCRCNVCEEARTTGINNRTRPSVIIEGSERTLIDAAPEFRQQVLRENITSLDALLITHAHNDHILGLGDVGDWTRWTHTQLPVFAPADVIPQLQERFKYLLQPDSRFSKHLSLQSFEETERAFAGYQLTAVKVPHGFNGWSYAFRFEREGKAWGYMPDCLGLEDLEPWRDLDLLILGTSFYHESAPVAGRSVYDVQEAMALVAELQPERTVFTHLGHGIDRRKPAPEGTCYAFDGMTISLP